jgi:hypothetical protein
MNPRDYPDVDPSGLQRLYAELDAAGYTVAAARTFARDYPRELAKFRRQARLRPVKVNGKRGVGRKMGHFEVVLRDGTVGYLQRRHDDCVQASIASLLQMPPHRVPDLRLDVHIGDRIDPEEIGRIGDQQFGQWTAKFGLTIKMHANPPMSARRWIGVIEKDDPFSNHCLIMHKRDCLFDASHILPPGKDDPVIGMNHTVDDITYGVTIEKE